MRGFAAYFITILLATPAGAQSFEAWAAKARKAAKQGDNPVAAEYWTNALRVWEPRDGKAKRAKAYAERADIREKSGEPDGAAADLTAALKLEPKSPSLYDRRGQIYLEQRKLKEALADFYSATKLSVSYGPAFYHRGLVYQKQGDTLFSKEDFHNACKLGIKEACAELKRLKEAGKPKKTPPAKKAVVDQVPERSGTPAPAAKAPVKPASKPAAAAKPARRGPPAGFKPNMPACAASIQRCSDQGKAISVCVGEVRTCEDHPVKGCCPQACVHEFKRRGNDEELTDGQLFRAVFKDGAACATLPAP